MADVGVIGAGTMGAGVAESAGMSVTMVDVAEDALEPGRGTVEKDLDRRVKKGRLSEEGRRRVARPRLHDDFFRGWRRASEETLIWRGRRGRPLAGGVVAVVWGGNLDFGSDASERCGG